MLGLHFCARAFSSCGERGPLFIAVCGPLTIMASLVAEHRLQMHRLSSCGSRAQLLRGMWDPPRPGLEPVSPALAGGLPTTAPPGKPLPSHFCWIGNPWITIPAGTMPEFSFLLGIVHQSSGHQFSMDWGGRGRKQSIEELCLPGVHSTQLATVSSLSFLPKSDTQNVIYKRFTH